MNLIVLFHVILIKLRELSTITNSTFLLRKLSLGEAKEPSQGHKQQNQGLEEGGTNWNFSDNHNRMCNFQDP